MPEEQHAAETDEFDWHDRQYVVVRPSGGVAVYTNVDGDIVIRQQAMVQRCKEDSVVYVPRAFVRDLIRGLERELAT